MLTLPFGSGTKLVLICPVVSSKASRRLRVSTVWLESLRAV